MTTHTDQLCTCGRTDHHIIARTRSADGVELELWTTGEITGRLGTYPPGMGRLRSAAARRASRLAWQDVALYDWAEIGALVKAARRALAQRSLAPESYMRRSMAGEVFHAAGRAVVAGSFRGNE